MFGNGMFSDLASTRLRPQRAAELTFSLEDGPLEICSSILSWYVGRLRPSPFSGGSTWRAHGGDYRLCLLEQPGCAPCACWGCFRWASTR